MDRCDIYNHDKNFQTIVKRLLEASMKESFNGVMNTEAGPGIRWVLDQLKVEIESGDLFHGRTTNYGEDESEYTMECNIIAVRHADGKISHCLAIERDISVDFE